MTTHTSALAEWLAEIVLVGPRAYRPNPVTLGAAAPPGTPATSSPNAIRKRIAKLGMDAGPRKHVIGVRGHPLRFRRGKAHWRNQPQIADAHRFHRARGGTDVSGMTRTTKHDAHSLEKFAHDRQDTMRAPCTPC